MPTTTKMGIVYPSSTDLVKDGATAMGTISTTVDSKTGLVLLKTASFSGVSSLSLDANSFSSNFDNYRLIINQDTSAAAVGCKLRMRASGVDNTSANYSYIVAGGSQAPAGTFASNGTSALTTAFTLVAISGTYTSTTDIDILMPFNSSYNTNILSRGYYFDTLSNYSAAIVGGTTSVTTSYDSVTYYPDSGTITGTYSLFGYNK